MLLTDGDVSNPREVIDLVQKNAVNTRHVLQLYSNDLHTLLFIILYGLISQYVVYISSLCPNRPYVKRLYPLLLVCSQCLRSAGNWRLHCLSSLFRQT